MEGGKLCQFAVSRTYEAVKKTQNVYLKMLFTGCKNGLSVNTFGPALGVLFRLTPWSNVFYLTEFI